MTKWTIKPFREKTSYFRKGKFANKHHFRDDMEIAETFNEFFVNIVPSLNISPKENYKTDVENDNEPILNYINKFKIIRESKLQNLGKKKSKLFLLIMFLMKKFLTKLANYKLQQQYNKMIFQQKF